MPKGSQKNIRLPAPLHEALKHYSYHHRVPQVKIIEDALEAFFQEKAEKHNDDMLFALLAELDVLRHPRPAPDSNPEPTTNAEVQE